MYLGNISLPLCLIGEEGSGKSTYLANWRKSILESEQNRALFCYHIGCKENLDSIRNLLFTAIGFFREVLEKLNPPLQLEIGYKATVKCLERLMEEFHSLFHEKPIMIIDGLDKLDHRSTLEPLSWITQKMINHGYFILSTRNNDYYHLEEINKKNYPIYNVTVTYRIKKALCKVN